MTLTHTITTATTDLSIQVEYDSQTGTVERIKKVFITSNGKTTNVTGMMVINFENDLNKIVDGVDWREICNQEKMTA
jgi:hypothetical protein